MQIYANLKEKLKGKQKVNLEMEDGVLQLLQFLRSRCSNYCLKGNLQIGGKFLILSGIYCM